MEVPSGNNEYQNWQSSFEKHEDLMVIARELAKDLIRPYIGRPLADISSYMGMGGPGYNAQVGGYMFANFQKPDQNSICLRADQIGVESVCGVEVMQVYSLKEIYDEVKREELTGEHVTQLSLFG